MAFRMVESTIRRIMSGLKERKGDEIVFAGLIKPEDALKVAVNSQHSSSKILPEIPLQHLQSNSPSASQGSFSYSSSVPLLPQLESILQGLEELSLQRPPEAVSTPFAPRGRTRRDISYLASCAETVPTTRQLRRLSSSDPRQAEPPANAFCPDHFNHDLCVEEKGKLHFSSLYIAACFHRSDF
jgi:hypothetical protein